VVFSNNLLAGSGGQSTGYEIDQSIRFNDDDSAYLTRTPSSEGNRRTFTFSTWVKFNTIKADNILFASWIASGASHYALVYIDSNFRLRFEDQNNTKIITTRVFRDVAAWYHVVIRVDTTDGTSGDRYQMYINGERQTDFATETQPSQNYQTNVNKTQPHYLGRNGYNLAMIYSDLYQAETHFLDGTAYDASYFGETDSATGQWIPKKYTGGNYGTNGFYITGADSTALGEDVRISGDQVTSYAASQYTGATGSYTYSNGRLEADADNKAIRTADTFAGDFEFSWRYNTMANFVIGVYETGEDGTFSDSSSAGNMQNMTDSWYLQTSSVAANRDIYYGGAVQVNATTIADGDTWKMTRSSGTIKLIRNGSDVHTFSQTSTNTVRIVIAQGDASADVGQVVWVDNSTLGNDFFSSGLATNDQVNDSPTNNFCVLSPLDKFGSGLTLSDGNLRAVPAASAYGNNHGTFYINSGKWVFECKHTTVFGEACGWSPPGERLSGSSDRGYFMFADGRAYDNTTNTGTKGASLASGDFRYVFYDADAQAMWFAHVDVSSSNALVYDNSATKAEIEAGTTTNAVFTSIPTGFWSPGIWMDTSGVIEVNFGQLAFATSSDLPSGFNTLSAANLADPTIALPTDHFDTKLWTGNDTDGRAITGYNFQPDWVWIKSRSGAYSHSLSDAVRGAGVYIQTNTTDTQVSGPGAFGSTLAFTSDGYTLDNGTSDNLYVNAGGETYVGWAWKANGSGGSNTDGSVSSTVSANQTAGFSIVKWVHTTSANYTVGHGLGAVPKLVIVKTLDQGTNWGVFHSDITLGNRLILNTTGAQTTGYWGANTFNSTVFSIGSDRDANSSNAIGYCFAEIPGYSKISSFVGNGNADGTFVFTGFRPAFVITKNATNAGDAWPIADNERSPFNVANATVFANLNNSETTGYSIDLLSNGFKARTTDHGVNESGATIIYWAFAEQPFKTANAR